MSKHNRMKRQMRRREEVGRRRMEAYKQRQKETISALDRGEIEWWQLDSGIEGDSFGGLILPMGVF